MNGFVDLDELVRQVMWLEIDEFVFNHSDRHEALDLVLGLVEKPAV